VFTLEQGNYIADVGVSVKDAQGRTVIEDVADGPYFMAQLPPGRYTVEARYGGKTVTRNLQLGGQGTRVAYLRWPSNPETDFVAARAQ
ncbi:MAG: carboxypeptidase-like regulatory domain-containing protein, partial [Betaproteobacteria bacterium]